ncbi:MAG: protein kinase [Gemmataceae bacterium]
MDTARSNVASCPAREQLVAFARGSLTMAALEAISDHLAGCDRCLAVVDELSADDTEIRHVRRALRRDDRPPQTAAPTPRTEPPLPASGPPEPPFDFGQYHLTDVLGRGGMGIVYRGVHTRLKKPVAIKFLSPDRIADGRTLARFVREMEAVGRLDHPNLVRATDAGERDGVHFLVMELIDGVDLYRLVRLGGLLSVADACEAARQAALGLQYAHENGLVHRDIKPSNLLASTRGEVKVLDLGLARLHQPGAASEELTDSGQVMGTADYMAPEQWESSHEVDIRADLYSLGCTLFYLLAGRPPYAAPQYRSHTQKMAAHLTAAVPSVQAVCPPVPADLARVVARLLAKRPADRYATPQEAAAALAPFCGGADLAAAVRRARQEPPASGSGKSTPSSLPATSGRPTGASTPSTHPLTAPHPRRRLLAGLVVTGAVLAVVGVSALLRAPGPRGGEEAAEPPSAPQPLAEVVAPAFRPGMRHDLLVRPPTLFHWWDPNRNSHWVHDPDLPRLRVQAYALKLLALGRSDTPGFTLQLGVSQERWTGGFGVFFAGRKDPASGQSTFEYLYLQRRHHAGREEHFLSRGHGTVQPRPVVGPLTTKHSTASWTLLESPGPREYVLELRVSPFGLNRVAWDGALCGDLVDRPDRPFVPGSYQGEFGLFAEGCSVQVLSAHYFPTD